jgi:secreted PhoX family phosphatase
LKFDASGAVAEAYPILRGTNNNCAGGATPWGTWLSCEEVDEGRVWETDPAGEQDAVVRPALGVFKHEAVAVDPASGMLFLTEDQPDGGLYRFTPDVPGNLAGGALEIARVNDGRVSWLALDDPLAAATSTRMQVAGTAFNGGEGIVHHDGFVYFTTKGDNRVWSLELATQALGVIYDDDDAATPVLAGVDNITVDAGGKLYVAEDGGDLQVVALAADGDVFPVAQLEGHDQSEVTGVAFDPSGTRLYFSSQRGTAGRSETGITFEITGPFMSL